jgi:hypothetical protein
MSVYSRWISSPWHEMPYWVGRALTLVALAAGFAASYSVGRGLGVQLLVYTAVAGGIILGSRIVWRVTHRDADQ